MFQMFHHLCHGLVGFPAIFLHGKIVRSIVRVFMRLYRIVADRAKVLYVNCVWNTAG